MGSPQAMEDMRIGDNREHDGDGTGRLQQWRYGSARIRKYDVRRERNQFGRVFLHGAARAVAPTIQETNILPDRPSPIAVTPVRKQSRDSALRHRWR